MVVGKNGIWTGTKNYPTSPLRMCIISNILRPSQKLQKNWDLTKSVFFIENIFESEI